MACRVGRSFLFVLVGGETGRSQSQAQNKQKNTANLTLKIILNRKRRSSRKVQSRVTDHKTLNHQGHEVSRRLLVQAFPSCTFVALVIQDFAEDHRALVASPLTSLPLPPSPDHQQPRQSRLPRFPALGQRWNLGLASCIFPGHVFAYRCNRLWRRSRYMRRGIDLMLEPRTFRQASLGLRMPVESESLGVQAGVGLANRFRQTAIWQMRPDTAPRSS